MNLRTTAVWALIVACLVDSAAAAPTHLTGTHGSRPVHRFAQATNCPVWSGGSGILADGDFSLAPDPGTGFPTFRRGAQFTPSWVVTKHTIDFAGSSAWKPNTGYCSVDLDGTPGPGGIRHRAFATQNGRMYTVAFLFSGNGACGPTVKTMIVKAAQQFNTFTWDISNGNDAQHGVWLPESWNFKGSNTQTTLAFGSLDPTGNCGPVIAAISVTQN